MEKLFIFSFYLLSIPENANESVFGDLFSRLLFLFKNRVIPFVIRVFVYFHTYKITGRKKNLKFSKKIFKKHLTNENFVL